MVLARSEDNGSLLFEAMSGKRAVFCATAKSARLGEVLRDPG